MNFIHNQWLSIKYAKKLMKKHFIPGVCFVVYKWEMCSFLIDLIHLQQFDSAEKNETMVWIREKKCVYITVSFFLCNFENECQHMREMFLFKGTVVLTDRHPSARTFLT